MHKVQAGWIFMVTMAFTLMTTAIYQSHQQARDAAVHHAANITLVVQRGLQRHFDFFGSTLDSIAYRYRKAIHFPVAEDQLGSFLLSGGSTNSFILETAVVDNLGRLVSSSRTSPALLTNDFSEMPFFVFHKQADTNRLFISRPIRISTNYNAIVLSKRVSDSQGGFAGITMMVLDLSYFRWMLEGVDVGKKGILSVYSKDGIPYMRIPYGHDLIAKELTNTASFQTVKERFEEGAGSFESRSANDGTERLYGFHVIPGTELMVFVGYSNEAIYADWNKTLVILLGASVLLLVSGVYFFRQMSGEFDRRQTAEKMLKNLATTDRLTGLTNRHHLDESLERHWEAYKNGSLNNLSVIFVDVDHFKLFNDFYGHLVGDRVLAQVAAGLRSSAVRQEDDVARYGGEEFVVVLPNADTSASLRVVERIRGIIADLAITHQKSPWGIVTVSIGVACTDLAVYSTVSELLSNADLALYKAKSNGRNRAEVQEHRVGFWHPEIL